MIEPLQPSDPRLLATSTREPFQPARVYFEIPSKAAVTRAFRELGCVGQEHGGASWIWLYQDEAASIAFNIPYADIPKQVQPLVLGRFRFPATNKMVLEVRSFERASAAAKFFGPLFGPTVVARRVRVINRWFHADEIEKGLDRLDRLLDANVTVIDPLQTERELEEAMAVARTQREKRLAFHAHADRQRRKDVPLVEDFPLAPEEEPPDFLHLTMTLRWRTVRAWEHWKGNTHLTLADLIHRTVAEGIAAGRIEDVPWPPGWEPTLPRNSTQTAQPSNAVAVEGPNPSKSERP